MTPAFEHLTLAQAFTAPARCPHCDDLMIAPVSSEYVAGGEIPHHWDCDGESTWTVVDLHDSAPEPEECAA